MSMLPSDWRAMERAANAAGWCLAYRAEHGGLWHCGAWRVTPAGGGRLDDTPPLYVGDFAAARAWLAGGCSDFRHRIGDAAIAIPPEVATAVTVQTALFVWE